MTQEDYAEASEKLWESANSFYHKSGGVNPTPFMLGVKGVLDNPTDFGLVSMETMFEFAEWCSRLNNYKSNGTWWMNGNFYSTEQLFQLFTTKNKEK